MQSIVAEHNLHFQVFLLDSQRGTSAMIDYEVEEDRSYVFLIYPPHHEKSANPELIVTRFVSLLRKFCRCSEKSKIFISGNHVLHLFCQSAVQKHCRRAPVAPAAGSDGRLLVPPRRESHGADGAEHAAFRKHRTRHESFR